MKVCILLSVITLAAALTPSEVNIIRNYGNWYGGDCYTLDVNEDGDEYTVESNGIPNHPVYVSNTNDVIESAYNYRIPKTPAIAANPSCVGMGEIGFALNGVPFFNPMAGNGLNAVQGSGSETFDGCGGHPAPMGHYHYHMLPGLDCIFHDNIIPNNGNGTLMGVALDGFPIYYWEEATKVAGFEELLDECHGTSMLGDTYRYYITDKYPYIIGCFKGTPAKTSEQCPDFQGAKNVLCSCANSGPPGGAGGPPTGGDGQMRPPFMQRRQTAAAAELLTFDDTTDSECIQAFACEIELDSHLWCHSNAARPRQCDNQQGPICSGSSQGMQGQYEQEQESSQGMQGQYGQTQAPPQMQGMQGQYGQQQESSQGMQGQYGQQQESSQGMQGQYGQQQESSQGMQGQYGQQQESSQGMQGQYGQPQAPPQMQGMQGQYGQQQGSSQGMQGQYGQQQGPPHQMQGMQGQYGQQQGPPHQMQGMQGQYGQQQGPPQQMQGMQGQYGQQQGPPQQMQGMQGQYGQQQGPPQQMQGMQGPYGQQLGSSRQQFGQQWGQGRSSMGRPQKRKEALIALLKRMLHSKRK